MKLSITLIIFLSSLSFAFSQTNLDKAFTAFKYFCDQNSMCDPKPKFFLNKSEKSIDVGLVQIPINKVTIEYYFISEINQNTVRFNCIEKNCFIKNDPKLRDADGWGIPFKTKENCYKCIDLLSKIKEELNK